MKIKCINQDKEKDNVYIVTFKPNWLQWLFGVREKEIKYRDTGRVFHFGGGGVYVDQEGKLVDNLSKLGDALDNYKRRW